MKADFFASFRAVGIENLILQMMALNDRTLSNSYTLDPLPAGKQNGGQMEKRLFTSESVTEGHPDKICDAVSDAVLDALMEQDPLSRVACETCTNTGFVLVMGEITTKANIDIPAIVRKTVTEIGYDSRKGIRRQHLCRYGVSGQAVYRYRNGRRQGTGSKRKSYDR